MSQLSFIQNFEEQSKEMEVTEQIMENDEDILSSPITLM
jgi:hypothetical protein